MNELKQNTTEAVRCTKCGRLHEIDSETYFTVYGNITIGKSGGLIGNNFNDKLELTNSPSYCKECLLRILDPKPIHR